MQTSKDYIKARILKEATKLFLTKGYMKVSMRQIATKAEVSLSNIYNYYHGKNELFLEAVKPVINEFEQMLHKHHGHCGKDIMLMQSESYLREVIDEYITIIQKHRTRLKLLFFHAQGSSLENFKEDFTERSTALVKEYFNHMKQIHPDLNINVSDFFIHLHTVWMFTLFEELIMHRIKPDRIEQIIKEYLTFEVTGWREFMKI